MPRWLPAELNLCAIWSRIVQATLHSRESKAYSGSSKAHSNDNSPIFDSEPRLAQAKPIADKISPPGPLNNLSACPGENSPAEYLSACSSDDGDNTSSLNDVESLKYGTIKTSKNTTNAPITILLVGETGVGKSSILELFANVLAGKDIDHCDFDILDHTNEQGGSDNQSQTMSARLYELKSKNGIIVRVLDTPGLADTRGYLQDERHKKSIATQIEQHIGSVTAVLILANGTVPRVTVGTDYALSTLSAIFPRTLAHNISFVFTNVLTPLHWNFSADTLPDSLKSAPHFLLNNPIALQKKYLRIRGHPNMKKGRADLRKAVKAAEQNALEMLVELFDWLDSVESQPTAEIAGNDARPSVHRTEVRNTTTPHLTLTGRIQRSAKSTRAR